MAEVLLLHHALGLTAGCMSFADEVREAGHVVHAPDLYEGKTFTDLTDGGRHAEEEVGFDTIIERGRLAADSLSNGLVYAGFSLGVLPAQMLAQTRPGARGALLFHACVPPSELGGNWPQTVPLQIHMMEDDEIVREGGDSTLPGSSPRRWRAPNCSCTRALGTCSRTAACLTTTRAPPRL